MRIIGHVAPSQRRRPPDHTEDGVARYPVEHERYNRVAELGAQLADAGQEMTGTRRRAWWRGPQCRVHVPLGPFW